MQDIEVDTPLVLDVDHVTVAFIEMWEHHQAKRPSAPEDYLANVEHLRIRMDRWEAEDNALRVLIGSRLFTRATAGLGHD